MRSIAALALSVCILFTCALAVLDQKLLVIKDARTETKDYTLFWDSLTERGYDLKFREVQENSPALNYHDETTFDHLILFAPESKSFPSDLSPQQIYNYIEQKKNMIVVLSPDLSEFWRDFCREFEVEFDDKGQFVVDHFHYDQELDDGSHTTLITSLESVASPFISTSTREGPPVLWRGVGHQVGRIPLLHNLLHAQSSAYSSEIKANDPLTEDQQLSGTSIGFVTSMQARNNARVSFVGSLELFTDAFCTASLSTSSGLTYPQSGNLAFIRDLTSWTFQEVGVLKVAGTAHMKAIDGITKPLYKVEDTLLYKVEVSALEKGSWVPYEVKDMQLEFTMLDPHLRMGLSSSSNSSVDSTTFSATFQVPDRHGVFTLNLDHRRPGWTYLTEKTVVSITPPRHDEYDRFIIGALPYYFSSFSVTIVVFCFVVKWSLQ